MNLKPPMIIGIATLRHHAMPPMMKNRTRKKLAGSPLRSPETVPGIASSPRMIGHVNITAVAITPPSSTLRMMRGTRPVRRNPLSIRLFSTKRKGNPSTISPADMPAQYASISIEARGVHG